MTSAERVLWNVVRVGALGYKVRKQHVIPGWIVDFYLANEGVVIKVDGDVHDLQVEEDRRLVCRTRRVAVDGRATAGVRAREFGNMRSRIALE
jgi:very-short-patch-repair endonuclease